MQFYYIPIASQPFQPTTDNYHRTLLTFVNEEEKLIGQKQTLNELVAKFGFTKRRLYDVINVFEAAGCCSKPFPETIIWLGTQNAEKKFASEIRNYLDNFDSYIPSKSSTTFTQLTSLFLNLFAKKHTQTLDYKYAAHFLSSKNDREKSTLNKLYQIGQILEIGHIVQKTDKVGVVKISDSLYKIIESTTTPTPPLSPLSVELLLNHVGFSSHLILPPLQIDSKRIITV